MELRPELMPPPLDETLLARLTSLAKRLDGARPGEADQDLAEFHRLSGSDVPFSHFQEIDAGEDHVRWVRRVLWGQQIKPAPDATREELIEVVRRAMPSPTGEMLDDHEAYMRVFEANLPGAGLSDLIYWPAKDGPQTPEGIVDLALSRRDRFIRL